MLKTLLSGVAFFMLFALFVAVYVQAPEVYEEIPHIVSDAGDALQTVAESIPESSQKESGDASFSLATTLYSLLTASSSYACTVHLSPSDLAYGEVLVHQGRIRASFERRVGPHSVPVKTNVLYASSTTYVWNDGHYGYLLPGTFKDSVLGESELYYACHEENFSDDTFILPRKIQFSLPTH